MDPSFEALLKRGYEARRADLFAEAKAVYQQAVDLCRGNNDAVGLARSTARLGGIERDLGEIAASLQHYRDAAAIYRMENEPLAVAHTIRHVGDILRESGQLAPALPCYEEALHIYRSHAETSTLDLANTLRGLALLQSGLGQRQAAIELWKEAGALYNRVWQEPGSPFTEADLRPGILESQRQVALLGGC
jgi:tetratricopeptide (TPR) repeat protein